MDYELSISELSETRRAIDVKVQRPVLNQRIETAARSISGRVEVKGFRRGKAPVSLIQKMYGDRLKLDVLEELWRLAEQKLKSDPNLNIFGFSELTLDDVSESEVAIKVEATLYPQPKLERLTGLEISYDVENFSDKLVEDALLEARRRGAKSEPVTDRDIAETGDLVNISYQASFEEEGFPGSSEPDAHVEIGSGRSVADLEQGLIGKKVGETYEIPVVFPADYPEETLQGKKAIYKVEILKLERQELPELTDEYAKDILGADSVADLRERFEKRIRARLEERAETAKRAAVFKAIYEANPFEIGDLIIEEQMRLQLMRFGLLNPRDKQTYQSDLARFKPILGEQAKKEAAEGFIVDALVAHYGVKPTEEEVDKWVEKRADRFETSAEDIKKEFHYSRDPERLTDIVAREIALEKFLEGSKVIENPKA